MTSSILTETPKSIRRENPEVSPLLADILHKCLARDPDDRYSSVPALLGDLQRGAPRTERAPAPTAPTTIRSSTLRRYSRSALIAGALMVIVVLALMAYRQNTGNSQPGDRLPVAVTDFENTTGENELEGLSGLFITALEQSRRLSVLTRSRMFDILKQMGKPQVDRINEPVGQEIARYANIPAMVTATVRRFDEIYTIELNVVDPIWDEYLFTATARGKTKSSIPGMIDRLAADTRQGLQEKDAEIQQASRNVAQITTPNLEAYQHYFQGEEHINRLEFREAINEFQQAIALDTSFGLAYARLAYVHWWFSPIEGFKEEPLREALAHLDRIPEKERYLLRAQAVILEGGDYTEALPILKRGIELYPNDKELLYNLGDFAYHAQELGTSITYLEKVLSMDPTHERALQHLTWAYRDKMNPEKMREIARRYVNETGTPEAYAYNLLAESYLMLNQLDEAITIVNNLIDLYPDNSDAWITLGNAYLFSGRVREGLAAYDSASAHLTEAYKARQIQLQRAAAYAYLGRYEESAASYRKSFEVPGQQDKIQVPPDSDVRYHRVLGYNHFIRRQYPAALSEFQQVRKIKPRLLPILRDIGITYARMGRLDDARALADSILQKNPDEQEPYYHYLRGYIASEEGRFRQAVQHFEQAGAHLDSPHLYYLPLIQAMVQSGDLAAAIDHLKEMLQIRGCCHLDYSYHLFSWLYYPYGVYLLGTLYEQNGQTELAVQKYLQVLDIWRDADDDIPELHDAKQRLAQLKAGSIDQEAVSSAGDNS